MVEDEGAEGRGTVGGSASDTESDDGPVIPDLEDVARDRMMASVAAAPRGAALEVASMSELNEKAGRLSGVAQPDPDVDLSLLTSALLPLHVVRDDYAAPRDWNDLFRRVSNDIAAEDAARRAAALPPASSTSTDGNLFAM